MTWKAERKPPGLSIEAFRAFYHGRPDEERWELIDGVPMMMAPAHLRSPAHRQQSRASVQ
jgi:hypothetical protein